MVKKYTTCFTVYYETLLNVIGIINLVHIESQITHIGGCFADLQRINFGITS